MLNSQHHYLINIMWGMSKRSFYSGCHSTIVGNYWLESQRFLALHSLPMHWSFNAWIGSIWTLHETRFNRNPCTSTLSLKMFPPMSSTRQGGAFYFLICVLSFSCRYIRSQTLTTKTLFPSKLLLAQHTTNIALSFCMHIGCSHYMNACIRHAFDFSPRQSHMSFKTSCIV